MVTVLSDLINLSCLVPYSEASANDFPDLFCNIGTKKKENKKTTTQKAAKKAHLIA